MMSEVCSTQGSSSRTTRIRTGRLNANVVKRSPILLTTVLCPPAACGVAITIKQRTAHEHEPSHLRVATVDKKATRPLGKAAQRSRRPSETIITSVKFSKDVKLKMATNHNNNHQPRAPQTFRLCPERQPVRTNHTRPAQPALATRTSSAY